MRKTKPIQLEVSITDRDSFQSVIDSMFLDIIRYNLENSNASHKEKFSYIDSIIRALSNV